MIESMVMAMYSKVEKLEQRVKELEKWMPVSPCLENHTNPDSHSLTSISHAHTYIFRMSSNLC
jgi:hypothetical protein